MRRAIVWHRGDSENVVGRRCQLYASRRWGADTKECKITVAGRDEAVFFYIIGYVDSADKVRNLADRLFESGTRGEKVYSVSVELHERDLSGEYSCRDDMTAARAAFDRREQRLIEMANDDPDVKTALARKQRPVYVFGTVDLFLEIDSEYARKIVIKVTDNDMLRLSEVMNMLAQGLGRIRGYSLPESVEGLVVEEVVEEEDQILVQFITSS